MDKGTAQKVIPERAGLWSGMWTLNNVSTMSANIRLPGNINPYWRVGGIPRPKALRRQIRRKYTTKLKHPGCAVWVLVGVVLQIIILLTKII